MVAAVLTSAVAQASWAGTLGFEEDFALAPDREAAIKTLIPGTDDYYYYTTLHYQNQGKLDKAAESIKTWEGLDNRNRTRVEEMRNRQALLMYERASKETLTFLGDRLGLYFDHERETQERQAALPTALDAKLISRSTLTAQELKKNKSQTLQGFEDAALERLAATTLSPEQLHELLTRLVRPDIEGLAAPVAQDLRSLRYGTSFGSMTIHRNLLLAQLDELLKLQPTLLNDAGFVNVYLSKLRPAVGVDWKHDTKEQQAYLDRLEAFVSRLGLVHNSLKAHVLYQRLMFDRKQGTYDKERFLAYLKLPRQVRYINSEYMEKYLEPEGRRATVANLGADYSAATMLPPISDDEGLVRSYFLQLLVDAADTAEYAEYVDSTYLKEVLAEAKITNGIGDQEKWAALLPATKLQALKDRVDLDFAFTNRDMYGPGDAVALDVNIKNIKTLIVKVYEVNAGNFYRTYKREVNTDINLDGLVANEERTIEYTDVPLRRVARHFDFKNLSARGVYVVEFIGNGKSSRALIRKGKLRFIERTDAAGHAFAVLDEANKRMLDGRIWLSGHEYVANKDGEIRVPYSTAPGNQPIVLLSGEFASLDSFDHKAEGYRLEAGIHVPRESLIRYGKATVALRPSLMLNDSVVSPTLLEEVTLVITSTDQDNVVTTKEVRDVKLYEDRETEFDFAVPDRLRTVSFTLRAKVQNVSQNRKDDVTFSRVFNINGIDATDKIQDLHLSKIDGEYVLDVLGKTGEPRPDQPVNLTFKHAEFRQLVQATLKSDAKGRITLGKLEDIDVLSGTGPDGGAHVWRPVKDARTYLPVAHGITGETLRVPYMGSAKEGVRAEFSLLEERSGGSFVVDRLNALTVKDGFLELKDLLPGDYSLLVKSAKLNVSVRVAAGEVREGWALSDTRYLQLKNRNPLQIVSAESGPDRIVVKLANAGKGARVHVFATRFIPEFSPFGDLGSISGPTVGMRTLGTADTVYESGRAIGDEYRYIIDRKYAPKFAGNMLTRPGVLLNPWAIRPTDTGEQEAQEGGAYHGRPGGGSGGLSPSSPYYGQQAKSVEGIPANLDFLTEGATELLNLTADEKGVVTIDRKSLGSHQHIHIVAVDAYNTVYREVSLLQPEQKVRDLRLLIALDAAKHFTEQKQVTLLQKGETVSLTEASGSNLESYDSLAKVYRLYMTLRPDATLAEFSFVLTWPTLKPEEKREKYSKYACHELNYFLYKKDKGFFETVVLPYLKNKKDKTFMDRYLLGEDVNAFLQPWAYARLNTVERVLLGQRVKNEEGKTARAIKDKFDLLPPAVEQFNYLFATAIKGSSLGLGSESSREFKEALPSFDLSSSTRGDGGGKNFRGASPSGITSGDGTMSDTSGKSTMEDSAKSPPATPKGLARREGLANKKAEKRDRDSSEKQMESLADKDSMFEAPSADDAFGNESEIARLKQRMLYRKLDKTMEWVENNYYHLTIQQQVASLIDVNALWKDYAEQSAAKSFLSKNMAEPTGNFAEMMFALSVLDLPFEAAKHELKRGDGKIEFTAGGPVIAFNKEIKEAQGPAEKTPILVSQKYFRYSDRFTFVDNEQTDKYVRDEFLIHVVYGAQVVVTNPTSSRQKLDALMQLPKGAMPVLNAQYTRGLHMELQPYETKALEYAFYFPSTGEFTHYPVQIAKNEKIVAFAAPTTLKVVATPSKVDTTSWDYLSQNGTEEDVLKFLQSSNIERLNLEKIAWRMKNADFYQKSLALLHERHLYNNTLWSYSIKHDDPANIREFLQYQDSFVAQCGPWLDSKLLQIDPIVRRTYEHMEYAPLVNARTHKLGADRRIVNERFFEQYQRTLHTFAYHPVLTDSDKLAVTYYLLLQDRVEEGLGVLKQVDAKKLPEQIQYDYFSAYASFYGETPGAARSIAEKYKEHPVDRWRNLFVGVLSQVDEIEGKGARIVDKEDRNQQQNALATTEPTLEFLVDAKKVVVNYTNVAEARVNYYLMDIELMFSQKPFLQHFSGQFSMIKPSATEVLKLDPAKKSFAFDIPKAYLTSNVMVEITTGGITKSQGYYANSLALQMAENYGQLTVTSQTTGKVLPKAYVKVYARMKNGRTRFYKDGYTDLRGKFDYTSLNTDELDQVERFALLVMTDTDGAIVREALPPKR